MSNVHPIFDLVFFNPFTRNLPIHPEWRTCFWTLQYLLRGSSWRRIWAIIPLSEDRTSNGYILSCTNKFVSTAVLFVGRDLSVPSSTS